MKKKPKTIILFFRYYVVAVLATITDFLVFIILSEIISFWYVSSTFISTICGGIIAFLLNRNYIGYDVSKRFMEWNRKVLKELWANTLVKPEIAIVLKTKTKLKVINKIANQT